MSGKPILTAVSSGTTEMPSPTTTRRSRSPSRKPGLGTAAASRSSRICVRPRTPTRRRRDTAARTFRLSLSPETINAMHPKPTYAIAVHGGAGTPPPTMMSAERVAACHAGLARALAAGRDILAAGGSALDAVTEAVAALEDDPLFNAGRGAVFTAAGTHEMDAAIMDGNGRRAGAVAGICGPKNPVRAARAVMEHSPHVLLVGDGAMAFCREHGLEFAGPEYFFTEWRWRALKEAAAADDESRRHGTVGAVARDRAGNLAAATYADNAACAVSATGHGEFFMRHAAAHEIAARMRHAGQTLAAAAGAVVEELRAAGGSGGVVAIDRDGRVALPFNSVGMYRGHAGSDGALYTAIFDEAYRRS